MPDTVQTEEVDEVRIGVRPEDAVAFNVTAVEAKGWFGIAAKVIVWLPCVTVKLWLTAAAAE
jgi:hypothetical protein